MKSGFLNILGVICIVILQFIIFGITFGTLFFTGVIGIIGGLIYIIRLSKHLDSKSVKILRDIYIVGFICFLISFIVIETIVFINMSDEIINKEIDYVVILGAGLNGDRVSKRLEGRLEKAFEYIKHNNKIKVLVSGGQGKDELISEAAAMENYLVEKGIDKERIILEDKSTSTIENIKYSKALLKEKKEINKTILLVTSDYHIFRAKMIAKEFGMHSIGVSSKSPLFVRINYMIREYLTVIKDWIYLKICK